MSVALGWILLPAARGAAQQMAPAPGIIVTVAGNGKSSYSGDGGPATSAALRIPAGVALDSAGNVYIADSGNHRVRRVSADGTITTIAGTGRAGSTGDGGPATMAELNCPTDLAFDAAGNLYILDFDNPRVRMVDPTGTINTVAGSGVQGFSGDGGPARKARLSEPNGITIDAAGDLFIADSGNHRVRKVSPDGTMTTIAGNGTSSPSGDGGPSTAAGLNFPVAVRVDLAGDLFVADALGEQVRKVSPDGAISTVAGTGKGGYSGDSGPAALAQLNFPDGLAVDSSGDLFINDALNHRVREVATDGTMSTIAGTGKSGFSGDGGPAVAAMVDGPFGLAIDSAGDLFLSDTGITQKGSDVIPVAGNERIREIIRAAAPGLLAGRSFPPGDVNGDGRITIADVILALRLAVGIPDPTPGHEAAADANGDGKVEIADVLSILNRAIQ